MQQIAEFSFVGSVNFAYQISFFFLIFMYHLIKYVFLNAFISIYFNYLFFVIECI